MRHAQARALGRTHQQVRASGVFIFNSREKRVQRSIGKKFLAVVAGVGLAAGGLVAVAPVAQAATFYWESPAYAWLEWRNNTAERDKQLEICRSEGYEGCWGGYKSETVNGVIWTTLYVEGFNGPDPAPCWSNNNCPVGGAIRVGVPEMMIQGVPQQLLVYASWRPDESTIGAPTNGDAVISMNGEPIAAAPFVDGVATFNFTPMEPGLKYVTISGVLNSNTSGANAWIDSVDASTFVQEWDPEALKQALKNKKVEVGDTYTLEEVAQAKTALGKRLEWRVAQDSSDVCAVTTTKKGEVKAKFTESGKCSIIWTDPKKDEEGKYTFKVTA